MGSIPIISIGRKQMKRELLFTKYGSEELIPMEDKELEKAIMDAFDFEEGYVPEGFDCAFLLRYEDSVDSNKDDWIVIIKYEKIDGIYHFEEVKQGIGFNDVINLAVNIIKERYESVEEIYGKKGA
jgi:hypothetical protein